MCSTIFSVILQDSESLKQQQDWYWINKSKVLILKSVSSEDFKEFIWNKDNWSGEKLLDSLQITLAVLNLQKWRVANK